MGCVAGKQGTGKEEIVLRRQRTLKQSVSCYGMGLHTGLIVNMTLRPSASRLRCRFPAPRSRRASQDQGHLHQYLGNEHGDFPGQRQGRGKDGGAPAGRLRRNGHRQRPRSTRCAGSADPRRQRRAFCLPRPTRRRSRAAWDCSPVSGSEKRSRSMRTTRVRPSTRRKRRRFTVPSKFDHHLIGEQRGSYIHSEENFCREIGPARTFGFKSEVDYLHRNGLARGGSLDNAVVVDEYRVLNEEGLRFRDEFVRHKVLDTLGDLFLAGFPLKGRFVGYRAGHHMNYQLIKELMADTSAWELITDNAAQPEYAPGEATVPALTNPLTA